MNTERVVFGFFIVLALCLNVSFVVGEVESFEHHNIWMLYAAVLVNLVATVLKLGDHTYVGAVLLATALVADLQLIIAAVIWKVSADATGFGPSSTAMVDIVSMASGALVANILSTVILVADTLMTRR